MHTSKDLRVTCVAPGRFICDSINWQAGAGVVLFANKYVGLLQWSCGWLASHRYKAFPKAPFLHLGKITNDGPLEEEIRNLETHNFPVPPYIVFEGVI